MQVKGDYLVPVLQSIKKQSEAKVEGTWPSTTYESLHTGKDMMIQE